MAGVKIETEVGIKVDQEKLLEGIIGATIQGFATYFGVADGASAGIGAMIQCFGSAKVETSPGRLAWELFVYCSAWSISEVKSDIALDKKQARAASKDIMDASKKLIADEDFYIDRSFLNAPSSLRLFGFVRDLFVGKKHELLSAGGVSDEVLKAKLDAAFNRSVYEVWSKKADFFEPLYKALDVPGYEAHSLVHQWDAYRAKLVYEFEVKPVFGQEATKRALKEFYVPLRGFWKEGSQDEEVEGFLPVDGPLPKSNVVRVDDELWDWATSTSTSETLKFIGGGPGSGKSTTLKALAAKIAKDSTLRALFIPLQHVDLNQDLRDAINNYFVNRTKGEFSSPPLSRESIEAGPPSVLIFDGLDEIALPGAAADDVANLFVSKLGQLVASLKGDLGWPVKVVVSGRLPSFQAACRLASVYGRGAYEVWGYLPIQMEVNGEEGLAKEDQRIQWWSKFSRAGVGDLEVPRALSDSRLAAITHEPLLCYLLALSGYATDNWEAAAKNRNLIYKKLIEEVWRRGWGDDDGQGTRRRGAGRALQKADFNRLMETIALAAWRGGDSRVASEDAFLSSLDLMDADDSWCKFRDENGGDVANLAMNFYLKGSESTLRGFEFTHKSFGEYLAACAIYYLAREVTDYPDRKVDHAMRDWFEATCTGALTEEILQFLQDQMRIVAANGEKGLSQVRKIKIRFEDMASLAISDGFPAHGNTTQSWRMAEKRQNAAEMMVWAVLNSCVLALAAEGDSENLIVAPNWDSFALSKLLGRFSASGDVSSAAKSCLSYIDAKEMDLFSCNLTGADLRGAVLDFSNLNGSHLMRANLAGASLFGAHLERSHLDRANLTGANLSSANIDTEYVSGIILEGARLEDAYLSDEAVKVLKEYGLNEEQENQVRKRNHRKRHVKPKR